MNAKIKEPSYKRSFDVVLSVVGLTISAPVWVIIPVFIYLEDRGPVFFRLKLPGKCEKPFSWLKFRTMKSPMRNTINHEIVNIQDDPRVTKVGRILRSLAMDELPQLLNILKGDMSFVGPRPMEHADAKPHYETL